MKKLLLAVAFLSLSLTATAQVIQNPNAIQFTPVRDESTVTSYTIQFIPIDRMDSIALSVDIGKPVAINGTIIVPLAPYAGSLPKDTVLRFMVCAIRPLIECAMSGDQFVYTSTAPIPPPVITLPVAPSNPSPKDKSVVSTSPNAFTWSKTAGAVWWDVSFAVGNSPTVIASRLLQTRMPIPNLKSKTVYTWQVSACSQDGCTPGPIWSVTTR